MTASSPQMALALEVASRDLPLLALLLGPDGVVAAANRFTRELCGAEPVGRPLAELLVEAQRALPGRLAGEGGRPTLLSFAAGGHPVTLLASALPAGEGLLLLGAEDLAPNRHLEAELARANRELSVANRSLQKANAIQTRHDFLQFRELTETAQRLVATQGWLSGLTDRLGAGLWEWDLETGRASFSPSWLAIHGLAPGTELASPEELSRYLAPETFAALKQASREVLEGREPEVRCEYRVTHPSGPRWLLSSGRVQRAPDGRPIRVLGVVLDDTERKSASLALAESELRFRSIFLHSLDGVLLARPDGPVLAANPAACALFDRSEAELRRLPRNELLVEDEALAAALEARRRQGQARTLVRVRRPDGGLVEVEMASCVFEPPGSAPMVVNLFKDLSALRHSEAELQSLTERLQGSLEAERARIARDLHDDLGQALTGLQLDLRWLEERLEEREATPEQGLLLDRLVAASELARATMESVQRISSELRPGSLDQLGLQEALRQELRGLKRRTGLEVEALLETGLEVPAEASLALFRIAQEALTNVVRHAGASQVRLRLAREDRGVVLEVADDGGGIARSEAHSEAAIGLLGMRERARALGGVLHLGPAPGGGTLVRAWVPGAAEGRRP